MARELEEMLRQQVVQPAKSCVSPNGVSFLDQVISPLYEVLASVSISVQNNYFFCLLLK